VNGKNDNTDSISLCHIQVRAARRRIHQFSIQIRTAVVVVVGLGREAVFGFG